VTRKRIQLNGVVIIAIELLQLHSVVAFMKNLVNKRINKQTLRKRVLVIVVAIQDTIHPIVTQPDILKVII
jgi:hypothetical protein